MTKITIHGQKMQYHNVTAISVTLIPGEGGTATFVPDTGTSYTLSSLPVGTQIQLVKIQGDDTYVFLHNNNEIGTLKITPSSGYELNGVNVNSTPVSSTPITLLDGDAITVLYATLDMPLYVNVQWLTQSYGTAWNFVTITYDGTTVNPNMMPLFINYNCDIVDSGFNNDGSEISAKFQNASQEISYNTLYCTVNDSSYIIQRIEYYDDESGSHYTCDFGGPQMPPIPIGTEGGQLTIFLEQSVTCGLVDYHTAGLPSPSSLDGSIESAVRNRIQAIQQMNRTQPNGFNYIFMDQDAVYGFGLYSCTYRTTDERGNTQYVNSQIYVAFYQHSSNLVAMPYERTQASQHQEMPLWDETHLLAPNYISPVFDIGDESGLNNWMQDWRCGDTCDLTHTIYNLAEYNI